MFSHPTIHPSLSSTIYSCRGRYKVANIIVQLSFTLATSSTSVPAEKSHLFSNLFHWSLQHPYMNYKETGTADLTSAGLRDELGWTHSTKYSLSMSSIEWFSPICEQEEISFRDLDVYSRTEHGVMSLTPYIC
ncbi:unnamed protein product [Boreogadus saida]